MISIVIPALNEKRYIGKLLDSIHAQKMNEDVQIVVADAHSADGTREIVESYRAKFADLKIVDGGIPAVSRNSGGRSSAGNPIFFIDADLVLSERTFLERNTAHFRDHGLAVATTPLIPEGNHVADHVMVGLYNLYLHVVKFFAPHGAMCIVVSRKAFDTTGGYPEDRVMNEDHDFVQACAKVGTYGILPIAAVFSVRRMEKEGRFGLVLKYLYATVYRMLIGPIRKPIFTYDFIHHDSSPPPKL